MGGTQILITKTNTLNGRIIGGLTLFNVNRVCIMSFSEVRVSGLAHSILFERRSTCGRSCGSRVITGHTVRVGPRVGMIPVINGLFSRINFNVCGSISIVVNYLSDEVTECLLGELTVETNGA